MTSLGRTSIHLGHRLGHGLLTLGLSAILAACGGPLETLFVDEIRVEARPSSLGLEPGGTALVTLTFTCSRTGGIGVEFDLLAPLPLGIRADRVSPASTEVIRCDTPAANQLFSGQAIFRLSADNSAGLGATALTVAATLGLGFLPLETALTTIDLTVSASAYGRNLLINPEFSTPVTQGLLPTAPGNWQGDLAASVPTEQGIAPRSAPSMLRFDATGNVGSTNTFASQQWQIVDVSAQAADIAAGRVRADASAWFNRVAGDASADRRFDIRLLAFNGTAAALPAAYAASSQLAAQSASILSSANAWEQATATMTLPPGTTLLLVEIYAFEDVANDGTPPEFAGHYADDISLVLTRQ